MVDQSVTQSVTPSVMVFLYALLGYPGSERVEAPARSRWARPDARKTVRPVRAPADVIGEGSHPVSPLWAWSGSDGQASFRVDERDGCAVVTASGDIDLATTSALREAMGTAADTSDRIIVDLASVTFIDMHGFSALLSARPRRSTPLGPVSLVRPAPMVRKVVRMARLDEILPIYESLRDALDSSDGQSDGVW